MGWERIQKGSRMDLSRTQNESGADLEWIWIGLQSAYNGFREDLEWIMKCIKSEYRMGSERIQTGYYLDLQN